MAIELGVITPHVPRIVHEDQVPEFQKGMVAGMKQVQGIIESMKPDVIVEISCHWPSTFDHFVDVTPRHKGILTSLEAPDMVADVPYDYPGDEELGMKLVEAAQKAGLRVLAVNNPTYVWDYGTLVPLRYLVPKEDIPIIALSVTWAANLEESYQWGQVIAKVLEESGKKAVFVASGAMSHNLGRSPDQMPSRSEMAMNEEFTKYLNKCDFASAWDMLPQYSKAAGVESGGRHLAVFLGAHEGEYTSQYFGEGQSSGSWNVVMTFEKK